MYAVIPENDPLAKEAEIPIEVFEGAPFIITEYTPGSDVHRVLRKNKIHPDIRYVTRNEFFFSFYGRTRTWILYPPRSSAPWSTGKIRQTSAETNDYPAVRPGLFFFRRFVTGFQDISGIREKFPIR